MDKPIAVTPSSEADILEAAKRVFGTDEAAQRWLTAPALGLNQQRPVDLLASADGRQAIVDFLGRLEFNVYT